VRRDVKIGTNGAESDEEDEFHKDFSGNTNPDILFML
jgi:hypothetical protein